MASVIRFGTIDRPRAATTISSLRSLRQNFINGHNQPEFNVLSKNRHTFCNTNSTHPDQTFIYDLGDSVSINLDYLAIIRADRIDNLDGNSLVFKLATDADGVAPYSVRIDETYTAGTPYHSPSGKDLIYEITPVTTSHRYWQVYLSTTGGVSNEKWCATQFYFGELFDIGADPMDFTARENLRVGTLSSENGSLHSSEAQKQPIQFTISWSGITDAKAAAAQDLIWNANEHGIVLYCTNEDLTDGYTMCHCHKMELEVERVWTDYNIVTMKLEEII